jgi:LPS-assembly protein
LTRLAALAATAGLIAPLAATAAPLAPVDVQIEGRVTYQPGTGRILVEDGAVLRRGAVTLRARAATFDPATGEVRATGGALLTDPTRAVAADEIRAVLGGEWEAEGVVALVKEQPRDLSRALTLDEARGSGRNRFTFSGARLEGDRTGRFRLEDARLTLCDCPGGGPPSWELSSRRADVVPGKRAILSWPVLRITPRFLFVNRPVPVFAAPWLYVPLGDRQTGLLFPELGKADRNGFYLVQPLFITLGRSADATLTAEWADGGDAIRGPGARLELRWAPAPRAYGEVELAWLHDLEREPLGDGGDRFAIRGGHGQRLSRRTSLEVGLRLAGDAAWERDHAPGNADDPRRSVTYRRSAALASHRRDDLVVEAGASYLQPLDTPGAEAGEGWGTLGGGRRVSSRSPALSASLLPAAAGPLRISGEVAAARFAPVSTGVGLDAGRRPPAERANARVGVALPLLLGGAVTVEPNATAAGTAYRLDEEGSGRGAFWAVGGAALRTALSRRYGAVTHTIAPRAEWRAGTTTGGHLLEWPAYDAFDRTDASLLSAAPPGAWSQLRAAVETRLVRAGADLARLEVGQDYDARARRFAETFVTAAGNVPPFSASGWARFFGIDAREEANVPPPQFRSPLLDRFTELGVNAALADRRGDAIRAGFSSVGAGGSARLLAGLDPLFDARPLAVGPTAYGYAGIRVALGPAKIDYEAALFGRPQTVEGRRVEGWQPRTHTGRFEWDSPCRCFRVAAYVTLDHQGGFQSARAVIDLSQVRPGPTR